MELDNIEKLLEKYFEVTTTVAEEETLRAYFSQDDVATHLEQYASMFQYFSSAKEEKFTKEVSLNTKVSKAKKKINFKWLSVAAVGALMFGIYFGKSYKEQQDAAYAYQETKKAMSLLAHNLNRGTEKVAYLNQFEKTKQKIYNDK